MPEDRDHGADNLALVRDGLLVVAAVLFVGAVLAYATGDEVGVTRTHLDASLVLLFVGLALLSAALVVMRELSARRRAPNPVRDDWQDS